MFTRFRVCSSYFG